MGQEDELERVPEDAETLKDITARVIAKRKAEALGTNSSYPSRFGPQPWKRGACLGQRPEMCPEQLVARNLVLDYL
jgi:hypothetical protein